MNNKITYERKKRYFRVEVRPLNRNNRCRQDRTIELQLNPFNPNFGEVTELSRREARLLVKALKNYLKNTKP